jgi:hypothetical protein
MKTETTLYPITYKEVVYNKKDCHPTFVSFYTTKYALRADSSVYISEGVSIFPNGETN